MSNDGIRQGAIAPQPQDRLDAEGDLQSETRVLLDNHVGDDGPSHQVESSQTPGYFVWALTFAAALSGLLFGYDTGVISSTLVSIHSDLSNAPLSTLDKSLITSITSVAALLISPLSGPLADRFGRKPVILFSDVLFVLGALIQAYATTVPIMVLGRAVVGLAIGAASTLTPLYIAETSPAAWRGRLVTVGTMFITLGQVIAYVVGWLLSERDRGWRLMVGLGAVPALFQLVALFRLPETPRWLLRVGKTHQAEVVVKKMCRDIASARALLRNMEREIQQEQAGKPGQDSWVHYMKTTLEELIAHPGHRKALAIACMLQGFQQICGFNTLMYFSASILALADFRSPTATALLIASTNFIFTVIAFGAIDRIGRRRILLISIPFMSVGLGLSALAFTHVSLPDVHSNAATASATWAPYLLITSLMVFVASYALGLGNVPWQQAELFPLRFRAVGSALATATNWAGNALVGLTFLPLVDAVSPAGAMAIYALICVGIWLSVWKTYPERMGVALEDVRTADEE